MRRTGVVSSLRCSSSASSAQLSALLWLPRLELEPAAEATAHCDLVDAIEREDDARARELAESQTESRIRRLVALRLELSDR
ncbi:hypothetical protein AB0E01_00315 [Nocardia vinacea]|uniref:hypothetical protein n=1 Tax=Nocardia vinacea TaxID=96468 RepID=UPI0033E746B6